MSAPTKQLRLGPILRSKPKTLDEAVEVIMRLEKAVRDLEASVQSTQQSLTSFFPGDVRNFGAKGDGVFDSTDAVKTAAASGFPIYFPGGIWRFVGIVLTTINQCVFGDGNSSICVKNGSGVLFTSTVRDIQIRDLVLQGRLSTDPVGTYTDHNIVLSGNNCSMLNCASYFADGRAAKLQGGQAQIRGGRSEIYLTDDNSATGYDIEIGRAGGLGGAGDAVPYCTIDGIVTTHSAGGILAIDTGSLMINNCQIGKLYIQRTSTTPGFTPGANGGITSGCRILGAITVEQASATFYGNQCSANCTLTFANNGLVSQGSFDLSNVVDATYNADGTWASGFKVTNLGNANTYIARNLNVGGVNRILIGPDVTIAGPITEPCMMEFQPTTGFMQHFDHVYMINGKSFRLKRDAGNGDGRLLQEALDTVLYNDDSSGNLRLQPAGGDLIGRPTLGGVSLEPQTNGAYVKLGAALSTLGGYGKPGVQLQRLDTTGSAADAITALQNLNLVRASALSSFVPNDFTGILTHLQDADDPEGNVNQAYTIVEDTSNGPHYTRVASYGIASGATVSATIYVKAAGRTSMEFYIADNAGTNLAGYIVHLSGAGSLSPITGGAGATISGVITPWSGTSPNWYRVDIAVKVNGGVVTVYNVARLLDAGGNAIYTGDGVSAILVF